MSEDKFPFEDCDLHSSSDEYKKRFSGEAGEWMLSVQTKVLLESIKSRESSVLDIGGGHGQIAIPLIQNGFKVTVLGSSNNANQQVKILSYNSNFKFIFGPLLLPPFPDSSFDVVTSFRIISHTNEWKILIKEMCRISRSQVIIDYPTYQSVNILSSLLFFAKKGFEKNTRSFITFWDSEIEKCFQDHGFTMTMRVPQFFFPMVVHRIIKNKKISRILEFFPRILGITRFFGSPVIGVFERLNSSE